MQKCFASCGVDSVERCGQESDRGGLKSKWGAEKENRRRTRPGRVGGGLKENVALSGF